MISLEHSGDSERFADRYDLLRVIGEGGMGVVYEAAQVYTEQRVALKILHSTFSLNKVGRERFLREARTSSRISHPGIVQVLDAGSSADGVPYLAFELLEGEDLAAARSKGRFTAVDDMIRICVDVLDALAASHNVGLIHRDIKPGNIFLSRSSDGKVIVKLLDFGITRSLDAVTRGDEGGGLLGTLQYMSPEQANGDPVDGRSDIFSVGVMLFEAVTGRLPFQAEDNVKMLLAIVGGQAPQVRSIRPDVPEELAEIIDGALQRSPEQRWQSAGAMGEALTAALKEKREVPRGAHARRPEPGYFEVFLLSKKWRLPLAVVGAFLVFSTIACMILLGLLLTRSEDLSSWNSGGLFSGAEQTTPQIDVAHLAHVTPELLLQRLQDAGWNNSRLSTHSDSASSITAMGEGRTVSVTFYIYDTEEQASLIVLPELIEMYGRMDGVYVCNESRLLYVQVSAPIQVSRTESEQLLATLLQPVPSESTLSKSEPSAVGQAPPRLTTGAQANIDKANLLNLTPKLIVVRLRRNGWNVNRAPSLQETTTHTDSKRVWNERANVYICGVV